MNQKPAFAMVVSMNGYVAIRCPECGHIKVVEVGEHFLKIENYHHVLRLVLFGDPMAPNSDFNYTCGECGHTSNAMYQDRISRKYMTVLFHSVFVNEKGNYGFSFIFGLWDIIITKNGKAFTQIKKVYRRYRVNQNGQSFRTPYRSLDTGKICSTDELKATNVTYSFVESDEYLQKLVAEYYESIGKESDPNNLFIENRFFGCDDAILKDATAILHSHRHKYAIKLLSEVKRGMKGVEVINALYENNRSLPRSKKFKRALIKHPLLAVIAYKVWKRMRFKDINSFWAMFNFNQSSTKLMNSINSCSYPFTRCRYLDDGVKYAEWNETVLAEYVEKFGEVSLAKYLGTTTFEDMSDDVFRRKDGTLASSPNHGCDGTPLNYNEVRSAMCKNMDKWHVRLSDMRNAKEEILRKERFAKEQEILRQFVEANPNTSDAIRDAAKLQALYSRDDSHNTRIVYEDNKDQRWAYEEDNIIMYMPHSTDELLKAGKELHNCVGSCYRLNALYHTTNIVLMKDTENDKLVGCIEVLNDNTVRQAFGPCNKSLGERENAVFKNWCAKENIVANNDDRAMVPNGNTIEACAKYYGIEFNYKALEIVRTAEHAARYGRDIRDYVF